MIASEKARRQIAMARGCACESRTSGPAKEIPTSARTRTNGAGIAAHSRGNVERKRGEEGAATEGRRSVNGKQGTGNREQVDLPCFLFPVPCSLLRRCGSSPAHVCSG